MASFTGREKWVLNGMLGAGLLALIFIAFVGSHSSEEHQRSLAEEAESPGYWGRITASIDWCEPNYEVSIYVAEFWNTISNITFILLGVLGLYSHPNLELRFVLAYLSVIAIGLGSGIFHATLLWNAQLGDEVPMLFYTSTMLYITSEHPHYPVKRRWLAWAIIGSLVIFVGIYWLVRLATLFQLTFGLLTTVAVYQALLLTRRMEPSERVTFRVSAMALLVATGLWILEQGLCHSFPVLRYLQLHMAWHLGTAFAAYGGVTGCLLARLKQTLRHRDVSLSYLLGFIPVLRYDPLINRFSTPLLD